MYSTDKTMGHPCEIHIFDVRDHTQMSKSYIVYKLGQEAFLL